MKSRSLVASACMHSDFVQQLLTLALASFLVGCPYAAPMLMNAIVGSFVPEVSRGRWLSVPQSANMLAAFFAPYVGGMLHCVSPYNPFLAAIAITPILSIFALTRPRKEVD